MSTYKPGDKVAIYGSDGRPKGIGEVMKIDKLDRGRIRVSLTDVQRSAYDADGHAWGGGVLDSWATWIEPLTPAFVNTLALADARGDLS